MYAEFFTPVDNVVLAHNLLLPKQSLGRNIFIYSEKEGFPNLENVKIAIIGVNETRNAATQAKEKVSISQIRLQLYKLFLGNWGAKMADLGNIPPGEAVDDTYFALSKVVASLVKNGTIPVIIGGSQDLTYAAYRAFDSLDQMVNLVSIDNRFDFGSAEELISSQSYMSKLIVEKPNNLFNFSNIGYQTYYNAQEEIDLMEKLFFEAYRLGEVIKNITVVEPVLRDADMVSLDMTCVRAADLGSTAHTLPNGFDSREICAVARYAGISDKVSVFGVYECESNPQFAQLVAQILWYFIEGVNFRKNDFPFTSLENFEKYIVPIDEHEDLVFYKSTVSERWWLQVPQINSLHNKYKRHALLPCDHQDYLDATHEIIPERWWKAYKKMLT